TFCHFCTKFLGQVGLSTGPPEDSIEEKECGVAVWTQAASEHVCVRAVEIAQFNGVPDVEWRDAFVTDKITRCRDAEQAEGEPLQLRIFRPPVITFANAGEKFIATELAQAAHRVDFVDEHDKRFSFAFEINFV